MYMYMYMCVCVCLFLCLSTCESVCFFLHGMNAMIGIAVIWKFGMSEKVQKTK